MNDTLLRLSDLRQLGLEGGVMPVSYTHLGLKSYESEVITMMMNLGRYKNGDTSSYCIK